MSDERDWIEAAYSAEREADGDPALTDRILAELARAQRPLGAEWLEMARTSPGATLALSCAAIVALLWLTPLGSLAALARLLG